MLWVRPQRRSAVDVSNLGILLCAVGSAMTAPMIATSPAASLLTCAFLAFPVLTWRHVSRNGEAITVRRVFGSRHLDAARCAIGYRIVGGGRGANLEVYVTDGVHTVNLTEHAVGFSTASTERDVARLTVLLLDPEVVGPGSSGVKARGNSAARQKVKQDREQIEAGREYVRSYHGGRDWWASRRFWLSLVLVYGAALLYATVTFVLSK